MLLRVACQGRSLFEIEEEGVFSMRRRLGPIPGPTGRVSGGSDGSGVGAGLALGVEAVGVPGSARFIHHGRHLLPQRLLEFRQASGHLGP